MSEKSIPDFVLVLENKAGIEDEDENDDEGEQITRFIQTRCQFERSPNERR